MFPKVPLVILDDIPNQNAAHIDHPQNGGGLDIYVCIHIFCGVEHV